MDAVVLGSFKILKIGDYIVCIFCVFFLFFRLSTDCAVRVVLLKSIKVIWFSFSYGLLCILKNIKLIRG
jgi:hypothetical protein